MKNIAHAIKTLLTSVSSSKITVTNAEGSGGRFYRRLGLGLLLAAFALTPNCPGSGSSSSNGGNGGNGGQDPTTFTLTVTPPMNGSIAVGAPTNATCSSGATDCSYMIAENTEVTLTATPATGYEFTTWDDDCSGTGTCTLTMSEDRTASARFSMPPPGTVRHTLTVTPPMNGSIAVGTPTNATCSSGATECRYMIAENTAVILTATADSNYEFTWGGDCSGTGTCTLTMSEDRTASATFTSTLRTLTVTFPENGSIAVSEPVSADCSLETDCTYSDIPNGTVVTLTATGDVATGEAGTTGEEGYVFGSWSTCPGTETDNMCVLTMSEDRTATASFVMCEPTSADLDCDQDGVNNGADPFPLNQEVQDAVALFSLGSTNGDFGGFSSACQTFLDDSSLRAVDMRDRGFSTAIFYGATPEYAFNSLHTDADGLSFRGNAVNDVNLPVAAFTDDGTDSTHRFPRVGTTTTMITIANLVDVDGGGAWRTADLFTNVLAPVIVNGFNRFWSFTTNGRGYSNSNNCSGGTKDDITINGIIGNGGSIGLGTEPSVDGDPRTDSDQPLPCNNPADVLCVAK